MRKLLIHLFCFVFIMVFCISSFSFAEKKMFKDVPWGAKYNETLDILGDYDWKPYSDYCNEGKYVSITEWMKDRLNHWNHKYLTVYSLECDSPGVSVAGYDVDALVVGFVYVPNNEGNVSFDEHDSVFYAGKYQFVAEDETEYLNMFSDLIDKISILYGSAKNEYSDEISFQTSSDYVQWETDDVNIMLERRYYWNYDMNFHKYESYMVFLSYSNKEADKLIEKIIQLQIDSDPVTNNMEGL